MKRRSLLVLGLAIVMSLASVAPVYAEETADQAAISASISELETKKQNLLSEIDSLEADLVKTIAEVDTINARLETLAAEMEQTAADLTVAEGEKETQQEAMKARIQYIYERGGDAGWIQIFLNDGDIASWLNNDEYTQKIYDYDRSMLQSYADACEKVATLQAQQQRQKAELEKKKNSLMEGQQRLEGLLAQAKEQYTDYDAKVADAYAKAAEYRAIINEQNESISQMVALQMAATDDYTYQPDAEYVAGVDSPYNFEDLSTTEQQQIYQAAEELAQQTGTDVATAQQVVRQAYDFTGSTATATGQALVDYAAQFLGNPYVYGGNSLTDGIDCSGFVQQVYANFGISTSRTSYTMETEGTEVSYNDIQTGDVVVYDGHVGIYAGNGQIINAADETQGIVYTPADYDTILSVRRFLPEESGSTEDAGSTDQSGSADGTVSTDAGVSADGGAESTGEY
ncbi:MAG: NlpC/P60 family protein [Eubacteriales bacterium]|nr:NlpC/P60 family protein [Eubacteriales bacterium]